MKKKISVGEFLEALTLEKIEAMEDEELVKNYSILLVIMEKYDFSFLMKNHLHCLKCEMERRLKQKGFRFELYKTHKFSPFITMADYLCQNQFKDLDKVMEILFNNCSSAILGLLLAKDFDPQEALEPEFAKRLYERFCLEFSKRISKCSGNC